MHRWNCKILILIINKVTDGIQFSKHRNNRTFLLTLSGLVVIDTRPIIKRDTLNITIRHTKYVSFILIVTYTVAFSNYLMRFIRIETTKNIV